MQYIQLGPLLVPQSLRAPWCQWTVTTETVTEMLLGCCVFFHSFCKLCGAAVASSCELLVNLVCFNFQEAVVQSLQTPSNKLSLMSFSH